MNRRMFQHPAIALGGEAAVVIAAYLLYNLLRVFVEGSQGDAFDHAFRLISLEQALGLFHEETVQRTMERAPWLYAALEWIYLWAYLPILGAAGIVVFARNRPLYRSYRSVMFASAAVGLVIFLIIPVAPPRMLPEFGFIDPLHHAVAPTSAAKNDFAAVPSFHFGFTLLAAVGVAHAFRFRQWLCALMALLPAVMLLAIVATANHFFLDAAAGAAVVAPVWWWFVWRRPEHRAAAGRA